MNKKQIIVLWVLLIVLIPIIAIFAVVVWPTKYKYLPCEGEYKGYLALRIDRFTGEAEGLNRFVGWKKIKEEPVIRELPLDIKKERPLDFNDLPMASKEK